MDRFVRDEAVLLTSQKGKTWLVTVGVGTFTCHLGTVSFDDIVGRGEGEWVVTSKGAKLFLFRPTLSDYVFKLTRRTQIIYPKDIGAFLVYGDIGPGHVVLETGVGSGALTLALLRAVGREGRVVSLEKRQEFARLARRNITRYFGGYPSTHRLVVGDVARLPLRLVADRVAVDLPEPWNAVASVTAVLRTGGLLVSLSPNVGQVQLMCRELHAHGYANIKTFELIKRDWKIDAMRARPQDRMIGHTGFITVAKKVIRTPATDKDCRR